MRLPSLLVIALTLAVTAGRAEALQWRGVKLDPEGTLRPQLLADAIRSYETHDRGDHNGQVAIVDFARPSAERRLFLLSLATGRVETYLVSHGQGSDRDHDGMADYFSDATGSHASSLGAFRAARRYEGSHGLSLALDGLDAGNRSARSRAIVLHSQWYVSDRMAAERGKLGRSWGCFAVDRGAIARLVDVLEDGGFIYAGR
jgi:hypothetical protein